MRTLFTFIVENPLIFLLIFIIIYAFITFSILRNKIKEIEKIYRPIDDYFTKKFDEISTLLNQLLNRYQNDDKVTNELIRVLDSINKAKTGNINERIKTCNDINYFVLNTALLRTNDYPELNILSNIELFSNLGTNQDLEARRKKFNELVIDYNHDILNPPNSIIVKLFGLNTHYSIIEVNDGKNPKVAVGNYVKIEPNPTTQNNIPNNNPNEPQRAPAATKEEKTSVKKVCPYCHTEFYNSNFCPSCGNVVD